MNFKCLWVLQTFTQWSNLLKVDTKFITALKRKQKPNFISLSWNLPIESIYLGPLMVIAVACIGSFPSAGNSSGNSVVSGALQCLVTFPLSIMSTLNNVYELKFGVFHENNLNWSNFSALCVSAAAVNIFWFVFHHSWTNFYPVATWGDVVHLTVSLL